ncbi:MAG TPA: hypothetical protein ENG43_00085 [Candidatus Bathyarchaeota archaeon]|nr:hypothetical protein [Candidatus Bathyarchaeota archaeon]HEW89723.1 hypothetical protein [Candidatus Bathyarchaeota archaeon]
MPAEEATTIRVKVRVAGMEFEIEAPPDRIQEAVDQVLSVALKHGSAVATLRPPEAAPGAPSAGPTTCKGLIKALWREGWFATPRSLAEVHEEMARRGWHYDRTAVAHTLLDLVREGVLARQGKPRRYRYVQKKPPS